MTASGVPLQDLFSYLPLLSNGGVAGVWIACWLKSWIVSGREVERADTERDEWKSLYMAEHEAHEKTREALRIAVQRGESTTEALQLVASVMTAVRTQAGHESLPEAQSARASSRPQQGTRGHRQVGPAGGSGP